MCGLLFKYREVEQVYGVQSRVIYPDYTNGYSLFNNGNTNIILNNSETIVPGASKSVGGNAAEIYEGRLDVKFEVPTPAPGTPTNSAVFTFKYYRAVIQLQSNGSKKEIPLL